MKNIENSNAGIPGLEMVILNPDGSGKYFEIVVPKKDNVISTDTNESGAGFADNKYNVRVKIKDNFFEINGNKFSSQSAIRSAYMDKKGMKLVICQDKNSPPVALTEVLNTFSKLDTLFMDVLPGNDCN